MSAGVLWVGGWLGNFNICSSEETVRDATV